MEHRPEREVTAGGGDVIVMTRDDCANDDVPNSRADAWVALGVLAFVALTLLAALLAT